MSCLTCSIMVINGSQEMLELFREIFDEFGDGHYLCHTHALGEVHHVDEIRRLKPDLVVIDQPFGDVDMQGWETVQKIRLARDLKEMPLIFTTTNVQLLRDLEAQLARLGVRTLLKPFDPDHLLDQVREALKEKGLLPPNNVPYRDE